MDVPEEPWAAVAALAVFLVAGFLFLLCLAKGRLSERQQTGAWIVLTILFFSLGNVLIRSSSEFQSHRVGHAPGVVDAKEVRLQK
jgi:uncharacterized membrane protein YhaH (DUF805 family)